VLQPGELTVEVRSAGRTHRVLLRGELDIATVGQVRGALLSLYRRGNRVTLDLDGLDFMDGIGVSLVLGASRSADRDGWSLYVTQGSPAARCALEAAGVASLLMSPPDTPPDRSGRFSRAAAGRAAVR
jgi:anti-anti-sigma factor